VVHVGTTPLYSGGQCTGHSYPVTSGKRDGAGMAQSVSSRAKRSGLWGADEVGVMKERQGACSENSCENPTRRTRIV